MWTQSKTKKERKEKVLNLLLSSNRAVIRGVIAIYKRQTDDEKNSDATKHSNNMGFCANDASIMSLYAKQILEYGGLSDLQLKEARRRIIRYTRQLAEIAEQYEKKIGN